MENTPFAQVVFNSKAKNQEDQAKTFLKISAENLYDISLLDHIANLQSTIKDYNGTITTLTKMLEGINEPQAVNAIKTNLGVTYNKINEPKLALNCLNSIPDDISTSMEKSLAHYFLGDYNKSEEIMRMIDSMPNLPESTRDRIQYNLAIYEIEKGNFKKGYYQYIEKGHRIHIWPTQQRAMIPLWKGEVEEGKTIIIHGEGGIGDEIIGVRFMNHIKRLGMNPIWKTNNKDLHAVFNRNGYQCVFDFNEIETFDAAQVMAMYLPVYLDLDKDQVWEDVYLKPCDKHIEKWNKILPEGKKLSVKWQGNMHYDQDLHRSIPENLIQDLNFDGTKISLQLENELKNDWSYTPNINTIEDTLAIMHLSDLVITSCTSTAHMAGAIGKKTIVCPPIAYYYVWAKGTNWYGDHVEVIRQENWRDWDFVIEKVQERINGK